MVTVHESKAASFNSLGLGAVVPSSCIVKEELNGLFELEMEHPYDEWDKWQRLENGRILYADTPRGRQAFRIYKTSPSMDGITVYARHIFYDLLDNNISILYVNGSAESALNGIKSGMAVSMPFTFGTNITGSGKIDIENVNPVTALLSADEDSKGFVGVFGGELLRDNYSVQLKSSIGSDRGVQIRYGKNLVGLEVDEDISEVATRIYATGKDDLKMSGYVDSPYINDYPYPKIYIHEDTDCETYSQLRESVQALLDGGADLPKVNIKADFQLLAKTEEYKNYAVLEEVQLGDSVTVINSKMGFNKKAKVISYEWDCLLNKYNSVELGDFAADITDSVTRGEKSAGIAGRAISAASSASKSASAAYTDVNELQSRITGNITIVNDTLYICIDSRYYTVSNRLFRWGINGLQFSSTGYTGTWRTLIDSNGNFVT